MPVNKDTIDWLKDRISLILGFDLPESVEQLISPDLDTTTRHEIFTSLLGESELAQHTWMELQRRMKHPKQNSSTHNSYISLPNEQNNNTATQERINPPVGARQARNQQDDDDLAALERGVKTKSKIRRNNTELQSTHNGSSRARLDDQASEQERKYWESLNAQVQREAAEAHKSTNIPLVVSPKVKASAKPSQSKHNSSTSNDSSPKRQFKLDKNTDKPSDSMEQTSRPKHVTWGNMQSALPTSELKPQKLKKSEASIFSIDGNVLHSSSHINADIGNKEGQVSIEESRGEYCPCMATIHGMLGNCLECGKIICEREAGRLCSFCGATLPWQLGKKAIKQARSKADVESQKHQSTLADVQQKLYPKSQIKDQDTEFQLAVERRNQLLHYDQTSSERSRIYDDQADYFADSSSAWLSQKEKQLAAEKEQERLVQLHERPRATQLSFDIGATGVRVSNAGNRKEETAEHKSQIYGIDAKHLRKSDASHVSNELSAGKVLPRSGKQIGKTSGSHTIQTETGNSEPTASQDSFQPSGPLSNSTLRGKTARIYQTLISDAAARRARNGAAINMYKHKSDSLFGNNRLQHTEAEDGEINVFSAKSRKLQAIWTVPPNAERRQAYIQGNPLPDITVRELRLSRAI